VAGLVPIVELNGFRTPQQTIALKPTTEEEACNMEFADMYKELEALERGVIVKSHHIQ
jgi:hypothetical protein